jgi:hypothetical protein
MNTPTHVVLSALALGHGRWRSHWLAITGGALVPDLPMVVFYLVERIVLGTSDRVIWSTRYFDPGWQGFIDTFNSLPFIGLGAVIAWRARASAWLAFLVSMAVHCVTDLFVHREDAHAHFFPFSTWRFVSPVSYWDPRYYGSLVAPLELLLLIGGAVVLLRFYTHRSWRILAGMLLLLSLVPAIYALSLLAS